MNDLERIEAKLDLILEILQKPKQTRTRKDHEPDAGFLQWYQLYPRKVGKVSALAAWRRLKLNPAEQATMIEDIQDRVAAWKDTETRFIPHPSTFLNQKRFDDPIDQSIPVQVVRIPSELNALIVFAQERGIQARAGESAHEFRQRVENSI